MPSREIGTLHTENTVQFLELEHAQILQDKIELLQNAGQDYCEAQVNAWAWKAVLDQHPELTPEEVLTQLIR